MAVEGRSRRKGRSRDGRGESARRGGAGRSVELINFDPSFLLSTISNTYKPIMFSTSAKIVAAGRTSKSLRAELSVLSRASLSNGGGESRRAQLVSPSFLLSLGLPSLESTLSSACSDTYTIVFLCCSSLGQVNAQLHPSQQRQPRRRSQAFQLQLLLAFQSPNYLSQPS